VCVHHVYCHWPIIVSTAHSLLAPLKNSRPYISPHVYVYVPGADGLGFKVEPKKGSAVLFYNLLEDGNGDDLVRALI